MIWNYVCMCIYIKGLPLGLELKQQECWPREEWEWLLVRGTWRRLEKWKRISWKRVQMLRLFCLRLISALLLLSRDFVLSSWLSNFHSTFLCELLIIHIQTHLYIWLIWFDFQYNFELYWPSSIYVFITFYLDLLYRAYIYYILHTNTSIFMIVEECVMNKNINVVETMRGYTLRNWSSRRRK